MKIDSTIIAAIIGFFGAIIGAIIGKASKGEEKNTSPGNGNNGNPVHWGLVASAAMFILGALALLVALLLFIKSIRNPPEESKPTVGTAVSESTASLGATECPPVTSEPSDKPETEYPTPDILPGTVKTFGHYEQDGIRSNGAEMIEWLVLDVQEGKALLLSQYALDSQPYNDTYGSTTWENCTLRSWLNSTFLETAFTEEEKAAILMTEVDNSVLQGNNEWHIKGSNNTEDLIFLLSYKDTDRYFENNAARVCIPTNYAVSMGADMRMLDDGITNAAWWWLRSPGETSKEASFVNFDGTRYTNAVANGYLSVRPALWIDLEKYEN